MTHPLSDAETDKRARFYANQANVSYDEAIRHVIAKNAPLPTPIQEPELTEDQVHQHAQRLVIDKGIDYFNALRIVNWHANQPSSNAPASSARMTDAALNAAVLEYSRIYQVNYAEALERVAASFTSRNFSEPVSAAGDAVQELESQDIEIFRAGRHIDSDGNSRIFTVADVQAMASNYNPNVLAAVLTIGHPDNNLPNYGRVQSLQSTPGGTLSMRVKDVAPKLAHAIRSGAFKKRSASFIAPRAPSNPVPGKWYLRHVGWLGAQQPAINGLADAKFTETNETQSVFFI